ncbi:MAG: HAMP domain-containing protein, partial [Steroidobacteraceae bacterium]
MSGISLKTKYAGAAFGAVLVATLVVIALLAWQHRIDIRRVGALANATAREQVLLELEARASTTARHVADAAAPAVKAGNEAALARRLQPFADDESIAGLVIRDAGGATVYRWTRPAISSDVARARAMQPIRAVIESVPGVAVPRTVGQAEVQVIAIAPAGATELLRRIDATSREDFRSALLIAALIAAIAGIAGAVFAWRAGRRLERPIVALIRSAERIGPGDYTRPLDVARRDALGELQNALERMRYKLRQTTINKEYLTSVLNSMT